MAEWWESAPLAQPAAKQWWEDAPPAPGGGVNQRAGEFATGINDVFAATLGAPADILSFLGNLGVRGINSLTGAQLPEATTYGGSGQIKRGVEATIGRTEPTDATGRLIYGAGQGVGLRGEVEGGDR